MTVAGTLSVRNRWKQFWSDRRGVAALEFALVAPVFFLTLFSVFEVGMTYTTDAVLQNAVNEAARRIRTGEVTLGGIQAPQFHQWICDDTAFLLDCDNIRVDVQRFSNFGSAGFSNPLNADGTLKNNFVFQPGARGDVIIVRGFYGWKLVTPGLGQVLDNMANGERLVQGTAAIRNEPF